LVATGAFAQRMAKKYVTPTKKMSARSRRSAGMTRNRCSRSVQMTGSLSENREQSYKIQKGDVGTGWVEKRLVVTTGKKQELRVR